jgi:urease accessory protein
MKKKTTLIILTTALSLFPLEAFGHHAEWMTGRPFVQGMSMPLHGLDHMLVTFAIGVIAAQMGGSWVWILPCAFSASLLLGGALNICGVSVPLVEQVIFASMIVVSGLLAFRWKASLLVVLAIVGFVATVYGNNVIGEAPHNSWFFLFIIGCLISSVGLLAAGVGAGSVIKKFSEKERGFCYAGWATLAIAVAIYTFPTVNAVAIHFLE